MNDSQTDYGLPANYVGAVDANHFFLGCELHPLSSQRILCLKALGAHMFDPTAEEIAMIQSDSRYPFAATDAALLLWVLSQSAPVDETGRRQPSRLSFANRFPQQGFDEALEWADERGILPTGKHHAEAMQLFGKIFLEFWGEKYENAESRDEPEAEDGEETPGKPLAHGSNTNSQPPPQAGVRSITAAGISHLNGASR